MRYWLGNSFPEDRDYRIDFDSQFSRVLFFEGWRFDSNQFSLNWSHALSGAVYYQFGRSNRQSWLYSWMMALVASTWWEIVGEPKEVIATNDQFMTGARGFPLGEAWYQAGHFLLHRRRFLQRSSATLQEPSGCSVMSSDAIPIPLSLPLLTVGPLPDPARPPHGTESSS